MSLSVVLATLASVLAFAARDTIERELLEHGLASAAGGSARIGRFAHADGGRVLGDVHVATAGGIELSADRIALTDGGDAQAVEAGGVRIVVHAEKFAAGDLAQAAAAVGALAGERFVLHVRDGELHASRAGADPSLAVTGIHATYRRDAANESYDVTAAVTDESGSYPLRGRGVRGGDRLVHAWNAQRLPLAPIGALLPPDAPFALSGGVATALELGGTPPQQLSMSVTGVEGSVNGRAFHALGGRFTIAADGIGTSGLAGTIETDGAGAPGVPFDVAGEVHDAGAPATVLASGTPNLKGLGRLLELMATQPNVKSIKLDVTAPGIDFGQYAMTTAGEVPHVVSLLTVDPHEPTVRFGTALAADRIVSQGERTSDLGTRTRAVAGINGDYFDIGRTYEPQGLLIRDGVLLHGPTDRYALAIDKAGKVTFAVFHLRGSVTGGVQSYPITQFNSWPGRYVSVITPAYGKLLPAAPGMTFATLVPLDGERYRVRSLEAATSALPVRFGLGFGTSIGAALPRPGDVVAVHYELDPPVDGVTTAVGSGPLLLRDGQPFEDSRAPAPEERDVRWPVIACGTLPDGLVLMAAVDGRHPERSIGMTRPEFAELLRSFGVSDAMALDSGGSVTMVSRVPGDAAVSVRNVPSDDSAERYVSDALLVYSSAPAATIVTAPRAQSSPSP